MSEAGASGRKAQRAAWLRAALVVATVLLAGLVLAWDWNWFKGPLERRVAASTGRDFQILGDLDVDLGSIVVLRAAGLTLANAEWSLAPEMARAELVRVEVELGSLLRGRPVLRRVDVVRPGLLLERNGHGAANWHFRGDKAGERRAARSGRWRLGELRVHEGVLAVRDVPLGTSLRLSVDSAPAEASARSVRLLLHGSGQYRRQPFLLDGWADSPVALLRDAEESLRLDVSARAGTTRARAHGSLPVPLDPGELALQAELRGNDLADLYPLLGLAVPPSPPYRIEGRLEARGRHYTLREMQGRIGDSDVAGTASLDLRSGKPRLEARLVSRRLDLDDLGGLVGLPPGVGSGETASPTQRAAARRRAAQPRLLPDRDYDLRKLNSLDADVRLDARDIDAGRWPVDALDAHARLEDGTLRVEPFELDVAGGQVSGAVELSARRRPLDLRARLDVRNIDLAEAWPDMQPRNTGRLHGTVDLVGHGNSIAEMLGSADGSARFAMGRGRFSNLLLELAGLDVAETLKFLIGKDQTVRLRCAWADFVVEDGKARAESLVFDTTDTALTGSGNIDLGSESLALEIRAEPKDVSPVSLRGPLRIDGTFKSPRFRPQAQPLLARVAAGAALYALAPPAALLALIEPGQGEDVDCGRAAHPGERRSRPAPTVEADQKKQ
jgi:uncharacterized protein involved in outer membrane biogenesis